MYVCMYAVTHVCVSDCGAGGERRREEDEDEEVEDFIWGLAQEAERSSLFTTLASMWAITSLDLTFSYISMS